MRRLMPLIMNFLLATMAVAAYALGIGDLIDSFDLEMLKQSFMNFNWNYTY